MTAQKEAGKNAKSGEETKTLSHFSKPNIRYRRGERYELSAEGIATVTLSKLLWQLLELLIDQAIACYPRSRRGRRRTKLILPVRI